MWAIEVEGEAAGGIGIELHTDVERVSAEIGYWLGERYWGRGIATEALTAVTAEAFKRFEITRLYAVPFADHAASVRVLEKAGYVRKGIFDRARSRTARSAINCLFAAYRNPMKKLLLIVGARWLDGCRRCRPEQNGAKSFPLTVDSIMRGPELVGNPPNNLRWSGDSKELYFEWLMPKDDQPSTWVVGRDGGAPRRLSDSRAADARRWPTGSGTPRAAAFSASIAATSSSSTP